jgi:2-keto-myo-inositol isomerase
MDRCLENHPLADLRALLADHDIQPLALNSIEFIAFRGGDYARIQARLHALGRIAQAIGCPTVVVVPSPLPEREMQWNTVVDEYVTVLRDLGTIARLYEVRLSFEFLGFGWSSVRTPRAASEILQRTGRENVGMTLDAAHFHAGGASLDELDRLDPARIFAFHVNDLEDTPREAMTDATRILPGMGVIPLSEICSRLRHIGYSAACTIELFRPEYWGWDPLELAIQARSAAIGVLSPYFNNIE